MDHRTHAPGTDLVWDRHAWDQDAWDPESLDWQALPPTLQALRRLVGAAATVLLAESHGGAVVYVPLLPTADHPLAACIGLPAVRQLSRVYGGEKFHVPKLDAIQRQVRQARLRHLHGLGTSVHELARTFSLTPRRVRQLLAA